MHFYHLPKSGGKTPTISKIEPRKSKNVEIVRTSIAQSPIKSVNDKGLYRFELRVLTRRRNMVRMSFQWFQKDGSPPQTAEKDEFARGGWMVTVFLRPYSARFFI